MLSQRASYCAVVGAFLVGVTAVSAAEQWPARSIRVISPFPAGSASDTVSRVVLDRVAQLLGQPMVIEARPGAGGASGFAAAAKAEPDGYTTVVSSSAMGSELVMHSKLPYDPVRDFAPVALFGTQPNILVVPSERGFKSVADLVAAAKAKPGLLTFASAGVGSSSHMAGERFRLAMQIDVRHVPFREGGLTEVMAGRIDFYLIPLAAAATALGSDKLTVLAVTTLKRVDRLPNVPSIAEAGYPKGEYRFWNGLSVPVKTPRSIVDTLHDAVETALQDAGVKERLAKLGLEPQLMSVDEFAKFTKDDFAATVQLARDAHIAPAD